MNRVCAVLVTRNRASLIRGVVRSLLDQSHALSGIIIVDNCSTDGTREILGECTEPTIKLMLLEHNAGHGASINIALSSIDLDTYDYFFFAEDDSELHVDIVRELLKIANHQDTYDLVGSEGSIYTLGRKKSIRAAKTLTEVNFSLFSGLLSKSIVFKEAGLPRTNYFMMCDDLEFCLRVRESGFRIGVIDLNMHKALHYGSTNHQKSSIWRSYYQSRNRIFVMKDHFSLWALADCFIWQGKLLFSAMINPHRFQRTWYRLLGICHGIIGKDGFTIDPKTFNR